MRIAYAVVPAVVILAAASAYADTDVKVLQKWQGLVSDNALKKLAPSEGKAAITDQDTFTKIWNAWGVKGTVPIVDFSKEIVIVVLGDGPNQLGIAKVTADAKGDVSVVAAQTEMAGDGFGYALLRVSRANIKSVNGIVVPEPKK